MKSKIQWLGLLAVLSLVGCGQIDQRSDMPAKKPLVAIEAPVQITQAWRLDTGHGTNGKHIHLMLAESKDKLYTVDANGNLMVINSVTGKPEWTLALKAPVSAGPTVAEQRLIVGTSDGKVITVDLNARKIAWVSSTTSEILAAPTISDDIVLVHTMDGGLSALGLADGRQLWRYTHNLPPLMLRRSSSPIVVKDVIIAGFANGKLLAMQKNDGSIVWSQDISNPKGTTDLQRMIDISADPVVYKDRVYASSYQGNIAGLTLNNGHVIWDRDIASYAGFAAADNMLYVSATNGDVVAIEAPTGGTYWLQTELQGRRLTKPAVLEKYLVIGDEDGNIHWLDKSTGRIAGRSELDRDGIDAMPIVHNNTVYILGCGGALLKLEVH